MEIYEAYRLIEKNLENTVKELGFSRLKSNGENLTYKGNKGLFRVCHNNETNILSLECSAESSEESEFKTVSKTLFDLSVVDEKDCRSASNEIADEITSIFASRKKVDIDKIKMPKAVSRSKAKNGTISYDTDSLANSFGVLYPEFKEAIKQNISDYGEFLPETFFTEIGTPKVIDVIKNGTPAEQKKLFKMLGYEDVKAYLWYVLEHRVEEY